MPHYGTLRDFSFQKDIDDIRGSELYGVGDEKLGKIRDVIFDHATGEMKYVVVDTGGWLTHKEFLIPAERVHAYERDKEAFQVDLTKDHIESRFPKYDEKAIKSEKDWSDYEADYKRTWAEDPVQHREDRLDLDVTPAAVETSKGPGVPMGSLGEELHDIRETPGSVQERDQELAREDAEGKFTPTRLAGQFPGAAETPGKIREVPAGKGVDEGITLNNEYPVDANPPANPTEQSRRADVGEWHPRMRRFEEVLKKNRVDVTASCSSCAPGKDRAA